MTARLLLSTLVLLFAWQNPAQACVGSNRSNGQLVGYDFIKLNLTGFSATQKTRFETGMNRWNASGCNTGGVGAPSFPYFTTDDPPEGSSSRTINVSLTAGFNPANNQSCGNFVGNQISLYTQAKKPNGQTHQCDSAATFPDSAAHELGHTIGLKDQLTGCSGYAMSQLSFNSSGQYISRTPKSSECNKARQTNKTPSEVTPPPTPWCFSDSQCSSPRPYCALGNCVECKHNFHCGGGFLESPNNSFEGAEWACVNYICVAVSPLAVYLPDYLSSGKPQNWWPQVCDPAAKPVCLDWWEDGNITCSTWLGSENQDIGLIATLSDEDLASVQAGGLKVIPARHLFGNVTHGPNGGFPYRNGFDALASFCDHSGTFEIDLSRCSAQLSVWVDDGDGVITADELMDFDKLGIQSLGEMREARRSDACGNLDLFESSAKCFGQPGRCGTWIDIYFGPP